MPRIFLNSSLKTTDSANILPVVESLFQQVEDQLNSATDVISLTDQNRKLPEGIRNGDVIFSLIGGELRAGVYNGISVVLASFGSFTGGITDGQHGSRSGGTLHEEATTTVAGFLSAADKVKLNAYQGDTSSASGPSLTEYPTNGDWGFHTDTALAICTLARNFSGTIKSVVLS